MLLVIDMQESLARPQEEGDPRTRLLSTVKVLIQQARFHAIPVGYVWTPAATDGHYYAPAVDQPAKASGVLANDGILKDLAVLPKDFLVTKPSWSAFNHTSLPFHLASLRAHTLVLTGISTNLSIESTARDAYDHRFDVIAISDAMLGTSRDEHFFTLTRVFPRISRVMTSTQFITWLSKPQKGSGHV